MNQTKKHRQDYWLSLAIFGLVAFGLIMIYSVSKYYSLQITDGKTDKYYLFKQLQGVGIGLIAWIIFQNIDYRFWKKNAGIMLFVSIFLLLLPILPFGHGGAGSRWIDLKIFSFQPAELAKLTLIFYFSGLFASRGENLKEIRSLFYPSIFIVAMIALLMLVQKDLGTLSIMVAICASIIFIAGASIWQLITGCSLAGILVWLAIKIEPYRMQRLLTFLNPNSETTGAGYHIHNALIAIGSGSWFGLGFGKSMQKYLYLPESHTDSIFAIICEELGFLRAGIVILVFAFIALRGYKIAKNAPDVFSRLVATAITTWLAFQMIVNIAAMMSIFPLTGVPLPFISYGSSSLVVLLTSVGILVNISKQTNTIKKQTT